MASRQTGVDIGRLLMESKVDEAARLSSQSPVTYREGEYQQAVDSALACMCLFGTDLPAHPTFEQIQAEYETVRPSLATACSNLSQTFSCGTIHSMYL
jgi:hypothetical protein